MGTVPDYLHKRGVDIAGVDFVPEFIEIARLRFPEVLFRVSSVRALDVADGGLSGVLAWYSLIHLVPAELPHSLDQMSRLLQDAGFEVLDVETRHDAGRRPHAAIAAIRR